MMMNQGFIRLFSLCLLTIVSSFTSPVLHPKQQLRQTFFDNKNPNNVPISAWCDSATRKGQLFHSTKDEDLLGCESRRKFLASSVTRSIAILGGGCGVIALRNSPASAESEDRPKKVLVFGGTGLVGARIVSKFRDLGIEVIATSRNGRYGTVSFDTTQLGNVRSKVLELASDCTAVISCIGALGTPDDEGVNAATASIAFAAKEAGVRNFVYITVAPEVKEFGQDIDFLKGYMKGKEFSRQAVLATFPESCTLIEPTFIYGGDAFGINPPRVAGFYGQLIEGLLASPPIRAVEGILPPGIIKIALEPPVSVDAVVNAAVAGALGRGTNILDTHDKIVQAAV